jgi:hypothetical protein
VEAFTNAAQQETVNTKLTLTVEAFTKAAQQETVNTKLTLWKHLLMLRNNTQLIRNLR